MPAAKAAKVAGAARDSLPMVELADAESWERWLEDHPDSPGVWLKIAKKRAPSSTVSHPEALEIALCFGWIDGQRAPLDAHYWRQRFTPRKARSKWSQINRQKAERLIAEGRMRPSGHAQVAAAKQDGRWEAAYEPQGSASVPEDFQRELDRNPDARAFFETLRGANRYSFLYRIQDAKRPETRARRIAKFVAMLNNRETFYP